MFVSLVMLQASVFTVEKIPGQSGHVDPVVVDRPQHGHGGHGQVGGTSGW